MIYDVIVLGSGPGGYVAAIRAAEAGYKTAVIEKENLGGVCLNWGCIPTKALLKSAQIYTYAKHAEDYGIEINDFQANFTKIVERSRNVAAQMSKGVEYLMKKNNIDVIYGYGRLVENGNETQLHKLEVTDSENNKTEYEAPHIILATGAKSKQLPNLQQDGQHIIGYRQALTLKKQPKSMVIVGSGAIGSEFACFYQSLGTEVTLVEYMPNIVPNEDSEASSTLQRCFKKMGMKIITNASVDKVKIGDLCEVTVTSRKGTEIITAEIVLSAIGVEANIKDIGLETIGVETDKGKVSVDDFYCTNIKGIYAIGDIVKGQALAHVASKEAVTCVDFIKGLKDIKPVNYDNVPACTYTTPEIASVGLSEQKATELGLDFKVGKAMFMASGKATAAGNRDGFVKIIVDKKTDFILGASMIGDNVTEMIEEIVVARENYLTASQVLESIHPHPTMSESVMEALEQIQNNLNK